jgi:hypothetical protein
MKKDMSEKEASKMVEELEQEILDRVSSFYVS